MLQALGLSQEAESVYQAMLDDPRLGIVGLCETLGLDEQSVRDALDELVRFDLARESRDSAGLLRAVEPEIGLQALIRRQEQELARRQFELATSKDRVAQAVAAYADVRRGGSARDSERLVGMDAILARLELLAAQVGAECLSVMPGGAQSQASLDASRPLDEDAMARGIDLRTLYQDSVRNDPATYAYAQWMTERGGQVRTAPVLPPRLLIFDRTTAVVPIDPANTRAGALCTTEPAIVASLATIFEQAWNIAVPLGADAPADPDTGLTPVDRDILRLLGTGLTDEAAGSRLGVSGRTVRRQMSALMERLGAASRFEAGLKAAQRGWL
jgi:DNA-binding CsgD family transcriptional regulator/sugar-specific transcriptional regulator TrmB